MYLSLMITFLLLLLIITGIQNSMPLDVKFFAWDLQMSFTAVIFYSSMIGGAIMRLLTLGQAREKTPSCKKVEQQDP
jgi:uncharacterized integral membrane protein